MIKAVLCTALLHGGVCSAQVDISNTPDAATQSVSLDSLVLPLAQQDSITATQHGEYLPEWYDMFARIPGDWSRFVSMNFREERIPGILALGVLTAALIASDDASWRTSNDFYRSSDRVRSLSDLFVNMGDGAVHLGMAGAFAIYGFSATDRRALRTASQITEVVFACGTMVQLIKHITGRERPERATQKRGAWHTVPNQIDYHRHMPNYDAFPSGHIATAFATVTVVVENYPEVKWLRPVGYTLVGLIGAGLVNKGWHWYSDFPLGLVLGYQFGMIAAHPDGIEVSTTDAADAARLTLVPAATSNGAGVTVAFRF
ncbi:MAG: phosphatase PAP2 family protein [Ignavibacteriae bacterium]|nr:phosphatase PAP2 family protein [Ignavibacteriota bacterium]